MKLLKKVLNVVIDIVIILIMIISILIVALSITSKTSGIPNIFGIAPLSVETESMKDTLNVGDLIFSKVENNRTKPYEVGDIVSFYIEIDGESRLNTHRIIDIVKDNETYFYKTKGDNELTNPDADAELKTSDQIIAIYTGTKIPGIGNFFSFIRTQLGFFLVILLPMILFFVYQAIRVIMNIIAYNKEKAAEEAAAAVANSDLTEEQKQRAIEEYLAKQKAQESETAVQTPADGGSSDAES